MPFEVCLSQILLLSNFNWPNFHALLTVVTKTACQTIIKTISIKVTYQEKFDFYSGGLLQCPMKCGCVTKVITIMSYFQKETVNNET